MKNNRTVILVLVVILVIIFWSDIKSWLIKVGLFPTSNYKLVLPKVSKWEGGTSNNVNDSGGYTVRGVTIGTWQNLAPKLFGIAGTTDTLSRITEAQWEAIVKYYWDSVHASEIQNQGVAELLFDSYFGSGWYGPQKMIIAFNQKYGTDFNVNANSNLMSQEVIDTINSKNGKEVCELFWQARKEHYEAIVAANPSQRINSANQLVEAGFFDDVFFRPQLINGRVFLNGWLNRLNDYKC